MQENVTVKIKAIGSKNLLYSVLHMLDFATQISKYTGDTTDYQGVMSHIHCSALSCT